MEDNKNNDEDVNSSSNSDNQVSENQEEELSMFSMDSDLPQEAGEETSSSIFSSEEDKTQSMFSDEQTTELNEEENEIKQETSMFSDFSTEETEEVDSNEEISNNEIVDEKPVVETFSPVEADKNNEIVSQNGLITVRPVKFQDFEKEEMNRSMKKNLDILQDISMHISVEIGRTKSSIKEIMSLTKGSVVELDKIAGEQVEVYANDKLVARGEVIVIEDKFGVRITTTTLPKIESND